MESVSLLGTCLCGPRATPGDRGHRHDSHVTSTIKLDTG